MTALLTRRERKKAALIAAARSFIGTPFRYQGRALDATDGIDCFGLILRTGEAIRYGGEGWNRFDYAASGGYTERLDAWLRQWFLPIPLEAIEPSDLLVLRVPRQDHAHLAIATENVTGPGMIHAYFTNDRVCEHGIDARWRDRIVSAWRWKL